MSGKADWAATRLQARCTRSRTARPWRSVASRAHTWVGATMGATSGMVDDDDGTAMAGTSRGDAQGDHGTVPDVLAAASFVACTRSRRRATRAASSRRPSAASSDVAAAGQSTAGRSGSMVQLWAMAA
jgi:hypothetical protein